MSIFRRFRDKRVQKLVDHAADIINESEFDEAEYEVICKNSQDKWDSVPLDVFEKANDEMVVDLAADGFSMSVANTKSDFDKIRSRAISKIMKQRSLSPKRCTDLTSRYGTMTSVQAEEEKQ